MQNRAYASACLSTISAGSMRFRWDEKNTIRDNFFLSLINNEKKIVPLELIHSKIVYSVDEEFDTKDLQGDGIITCNENLVPVITVADCMPIYLWDKKTGCFGVLHSGWKGTGIITEALLLANKKYGAKPSDFFVVIGPHIRDCCYLIDEQRADYFIENFCDDCVEKKSDGKNYSLSLEKANLFLLEKIGVKKENIQILGECTCCSKNKDGIGQYGSFRRQTAHFPPNSPLKEMQKHFTPMAAFMHLGTKKIDGNDKLLVQNLP